jgi:hypothetical protein
MMNLPLPNNRLPDSDHALSSIGGLPASAAAPLKQLTLSEFLKPMMAALQQRQPWVDDFRNDPIMLPVDLYEVVREFARLQTGPAS